MWYLIKHLVWQTWFLAFFFKSLLDIDILRDSKSRFCFKLLVLLTMLFLWLHNACNCVPSSLADIAIITFSFKLLSCNDILIDVFRIGLNTIILLRFFCIVFSSNWRMSIFYFSQLFEVFLNQIQIDVVIFEPTNNIDIKRCKLLFKESILVLASQSSWTISLWAFQKILEVLDEVLRLLTHLFIRKYLSWNLKFLNFTYKGTDGGVEMILDRIVCTSRNILGYLSPFIAMYFVCLNEYKFFIFIPLAFPYFWIKMVVPSFSALFTISIRRCSSRSDFISNDIPSFGSELFNEYADKDVFFYLPMLTLFSPIITKILENFL